MIIFNIITTIVIPLMMFMLFVIYFIVIFTDYGFGRVIDYCKKIGKTISNFNKKRKDKWLIII